MTEVRRINPEDGFVREFTEFRDRVKSLETAPAGNIVIRETLTTEDPETGVKTTIGLLPDGTYGFQPFIGDVVPPPVATTPVVSSQPGSVVVSWDGLFVGNEAKPNDFQHVTVVAHKIVDSATVLSVEVGVIRLSTESVIITTDLLAPGENWEFSLESEDYNGNRAVASTRSTTITVLGYVDDSGVAAAMDDLRQAAEDADAAAQAAQTAAGNAQEDADAAAAAALAASNLAGSKGVVYTQSATPSADYSGLWIDTAHNNIPRRYLGIRKALFINAGGGASVGTRLTSKGWAVSAITTTPSLQDAVKYDLVAFDAGFAGIGATAATRIAELYERGVSMYTSGNDTTTIAPLFTGAVNRGTPKNSIQGTTNSTGITYTSYSDADLNYYLTGVNSAAVVTGTTLVTSLGTNQPINLAMEHPTNFSRWVHIQTYATPSAVIDLHLDWISDNWVAIQDQGVIAAAAAAGAAQIKADQAFANAASAATAAGNAQTSANSKNTNWYQDDQPAGTGHKVGDTWFDTNDNYKLRTWNGSIWQTTQDSYLAQQTADSKGVIYTQSVTPPVSARLPQNLWNDTSLGEDKVVTKYWSTVANAWTPIADKEATEARTVADSKGETIYSDTAPAAAKQLPQNLWIDTTGGLNISKRWNGSGWIVVADQRIASTATAVTAADAKAQNAYNEALAKSTIYTQNFVPPVEARLPQTIWNDTTLGLDKVVVKYWSTTAGAWTPLADKEATEARVVADAKGETIYSDTEPAVAKRLPQNLWIDTTGGINLNKRWNGSGWITVVDARIPSTAAAVTAADAKAQTAVNDAATKSIVYTQPTTPPVEARLPQTLWNDTSLGDNNIVVKYWSTVAGAWTALTDKAATEARTVADAKGETIFSSTEPTVAQRLPQNLWIDTTGGVNISKRWNGAAWAIVADTRIASTAAAVTAVDAKADAKSVVYTQSTVPPIEARLPQTLWNDTSLGLNNIVVKYWNGSQWTALADKTATDAAAVADSKGETIYSDTEPVAAKRLTQNLWIDTTGGINLHKRWTGAAWVVVADTRIAATAAAVTAVDAKADTKSVVYTQSTTPPVEARLPQTLWNDTSLGLDKIVVKYWSGSTWATLADKAATDAAAVADSKGETIYSDTEPAASKRLAQNLWVDTNGGLNINKRWNGSAWVVVVDARIPSTAIAVTAADAKAQTAVNDAATKSIVYTQSTTPPVSARLPQTLWNDTSLGLANVVVKYWDGDSWEALADKVATDAATVAATKTKTYFQPASPGTVGNTTGDLWFDTDDNNKPYVWNGAWTLAQDATATKALFGTFPTDIDQTAPNKWLLTKYDKLGLSNTVIPSYLDIVGLAGTSSLVPDGANLASSLGDNYIGQLRTVVNVAVGKSISVTASHDDGAAIYVDGVAVYTKNVVTNGAPISFALTAGWHVIDLLWIEVSGADGWFNISPTFGSQVTSMYAPVSLTATSQAVSAAQAAATNAMNAQSYSTNASFDDWTGALPANYATWGSTTPVKETSIVRRAPFALRYNCADASTQAGILLNSNVNHAPNLEYVTVEIEFQLVSGTLGGSGLLVDWNATNYVRSTVALLTEVPAAETGKWYRVTKVLRRPAGLTGTFTKINGYLMAQYSAGMGTQATKNIVFDWLNIRPATNEEIISYGAPAKYTELETATAAKGEVIYSDSAPAAAKQLAQNLWVDTTGGINLHKRWTGSAWAVVADARIAQTITDLAAISSQVSAVSAQADRSISTFYGTSTPSAPESGDLWLTGTAGDPMKRYNGSAWVAFEDPNVQAAYTKAGDAQSAADAKVRTFAQDGEPTGMVPNDIGDLWIDTNDKNKLYRYNGATWDELRDDTIADAQGTANTALTTASTAVTAASAAQTTADGKNTSYYQPGQPTGGAYKIGDLWFDTDDNYKMRTFAGGSTWQLTQDSAGAQAAAISAAASDATTKATNAQAAAIAAAALDATTKANQAKADAIAAATTADKIPGKWIYSFLDDFVAGAAPAPTVFTGPGVVRTLVNDGASLVSNVSDTYRGSLRTMVRVASSKTISVTALHDDAGSVYVDGVKVYGNTGFAATAPISFPLTAGWHMIELTWAENAGGDGWYNITPTFGSQVDELAAPSGASSAQWDAAQALASAADDATTKVATAKAEAIAAAALDATGKANSAELAAIQAQAYSLNPSFDDWTGTFPAAYANWASTPTKETSTKRRGANAMRFDVTNSATNAGVQVASTIAHAPNIEYFTVEIEAYLVSGTFSGAGVLLDWNGLTPYRSILKLGDEIPTPLVGKWYRIVKTLRRPTGSSGTWISMGGFLMANYVEAGTTAVKNIIFDWFNVRPATSEEITAYGTPASITNLTNTVNTKTKSWFQTDTPPLTGNTTGDLWFDTDDGNKIYIWNGAWTVAQDGQIASLNTSVSAAMTAANGKNKVIYSTADATGTTGYSAGDTWFKRDGGNNIIGQWEFTTSWQPRAIGNDLIAANINAGKITAGTLSADRIGANTINASKLTVSDPEELIPNPFFHPSGEPIVAGSGTIITTASSEVSAGAPYPYAIKIQARDNHPFATANIAVRPGDQFYMEAYVCAAPTTTRNFNFYIFGANQPVGGLTAKFNSGQAVTGTWTKKTYSFTVPLNATYTYIKPVLQVETVGGDTADKWMWYVTGWSMRRKNTGELIVDGAIKANSAIIETGAIGNAHIGNAAVDTAEIKDLAVTVAKINDLAVTNAKIDNLAVTDAKIDALAVKTAKIDNLAVTEGKIDNLAITNAKIKDATIEHGKIATIDAGKITVGLLQGHQIAANAIDASKLNVSLGGSNLITNSSFEADSDGNGLADSWEVWARGSGDAGRIFTNTRTAGLFPGSTFAQKVESTTVTNTNQSSLQATQLFSIAEGASATISLYGRASVAGGFQISIRCQDANALYLGDAQYIADFTTSTQRFSGTVITPANTTHGKLTITTPASLSNGHWFEADGVQVELGNVASSWGPKTEELLPGTIKAGMLAADSVTATSISVTALNGKTITGSTIQTEATANRGIKLTTTELAGYDGAGVKNFSLTSAGALTLKGAIQSGSTIEGATITGTTGIQTSGTAQRGVKITNTGVSAFDGSGNMTFRVDGSTGLVEAPGIKANSIKGDKIEAGTVSADKLLISDFTNLLDDPSLVGPGWIKGANPNNATIIFDNNEKTNVWRLTAMGQQVDVTNSNVIPVKATDRFLLDARTYSTLNASGYLRVTYHTETMALLGTGGVVDLTIPANSSTWTPRQMELFPPATAKFMKVQPIIGATATTGTILYGSMTLRRRFGGELIVDGAINGQTITGATVQTETTANRGIKLTGTELAGYDGAGVKNFSLTSAGTLALRGTLNAGSSIVGATITGTEGIQTSSTALRGVKITNTGVSAFDNSGNMTFKVDGTTGVVEAPGMKANSITGDKIAAKTIGVDKLTVQDFSNYVENPGFETGDLTGWDVVGTWYVNNAAPHAGTYKALVGYNGTVQSITNKAEVTLPVGGKVRVKFRIYSETPSVSGVQASLALYNSVGGALESVTNIAQTGSWIEIDRELTAATAGAKRLQISTSGAGTGYLRVDSIVMNRMMNGELIVDGAIDGKVITGATIQTDSTPASAARGIKLTSTEFAGYDAAGVKNFSLTSAGALSIRGAIQAGSTITGTTITGSEGIQTSETPLRGIKITNTGVSAYDNSGNMTFKVDGTTGIVEAPGLKANSISSTMISATAIDGKTITGATLTGGLIQTETTPNRGIKLTTTELAGYDGAGVKNFSLTSAGDLVVKGLIKSGSSIEGATITGTDGIQTSAAALRGIKITNSGVSAFDNSGAMTFKVDGTTGIVEAPGMKANSITGDKIAAKTLTADLMVLGGTTNLFDDGPFASKNINHWEVNGSPAAVVFTEDTLSFNRSGASLIRLIGRKWEPVTPGEKFYASVPTITGPGAGTFEFYAYTLTDAGTQTNSLIVGNLTTVGPHVVEWTVPANIVAIKPYLYIAADVTAGATLKISRPQLLRKVVGSLIVDGAINGQSITGATITGGLIQTETTPNRGIKLTSSELSGYDNAGVKNFALTSAGALTIRGTIESGSTIKGATLAAAGGGIETTTTAARGVKLKDTGITTYDSAGNMTFSVDASTGEVQAPGLKANTIKGTMIDSQTITARNLFVGDFANLATIDELNGVTIASNGQTQIVAGYNKLVTDSGTYLMFTEKRGPVPFALGDTLYYEFYAKANASTTVQFGIWTYDAVDANTSIVSINEPLTTVERLVSGQVAVSAYRANATKFIVGLNGVANKGIQVRAVKVYKKYGGQLIVDGAIDGKTITGATIQTVNTVDRGIKLTSAELAGYDNAGVKNFSLASDGTLAVRGTIKSGSSIEAVTLSAGGGGIETTITPARGVKLKDTGITTYDSSGNMTFSVNASTGEVEAPGIKANSIKGDKIESGTISANKLLISNSSNLLVDPNFWDANINEAKLGGSTGGSAGWTVNAGTSTGLRSVTRTTTTTNDILQLSPFTNGSGKQTQAIQVQEGQKWIFTIDVETNVSAGVRWNVYRYLADGTTSYVSASPFNTGTGRRELSYVWEVPAGVVAFSPSLACNVSGAVFTAHGNGFIGQQASATLIEDGAITTDHITVGTLDGGVISAGTLTATEIKGKSVSIDKLLITSTDNLIQEGDFSGEGSSWQLPTNFAVNATASRKSLPALVITNTAALQTSYNSVGAPVKTPIEFQSDAGNSYRMEGWVRSTVSVPVSAAFMSARFTSTSGSTTEKIAIYSTSVSSSSTPPSAWETPQIVPANTWTQISGMVTAPLGTSSVAFAVNSAANLSTGTLTWDSVSVTRGTNGKLVVDGSITADKLEAKLVLATKIIAGDATGTYAEMSPDGFRVFADGVDNGPSTEVVRLGVAATNDFFAITKSNGTVAATISSEGVGSFDKLSIPAYDPSTETNNVITGLPEYGTGTGGLWYGGDEFQTHLNQGRLIARAYRNTSSLYNAANGVTQPYCRLDRVFLKKGNLYRISTGPVRMDHDAGATGYMTIWWKSSTTDQNVAATVGGSSVAIAETVSDAGPVRTSDASMALVAPTEDCWASFLFSFTSQGPGQVGLRSSSAAPFRMLVENLGRDVGTSGIYMDGTNPPPPAVNTYQKQYGATAIRSFDGNNNFYNFDTGHMYQGLSPAGYGNLKSLSIHQNMTADLAGATINWMRVYFLFDHWYYNSGGTARVGVHGHTSLPGTFNGTGVATFSASGIPKPGDRWINIPSNLWNGFATGASRGVLLEGDSTYGTYGYARPPVIEINYTK